MKKGTRAHYAAHKEKTRALVAAKIDHWSEFYRKIGHDFPSRLRRVAIRNQRSRWGSCSKQGNLNFNYRLGLLPEQLADYVIVHELCHLGEFNHSQAFWDLVAQAIPDHQERRAELRRAELQHVERVMSGGSANKIIEIVDEKTKEKGAPAWRLRFLRRF